MSRSIPRPWKFKHGRCFSPEYRSWQSMKTRCYNAKDGHYPRYGGRGIVVCERWLDSFENFYEDRGDKPSPQHTLERENNDGDYTPENCVWATKKEQARNRSDSRLLTVRGVTKTLAEWADERSLNHQTVHERLKRGRSDEEAVMTPIQIVWPHKKGI